MGHYQHLNGTSAFYQNTPNFEFPIQNACGLSYYLLRHQTCHRARLLVIS